MVLFSELSNNNRYKTNSNSPDKFILLNLDIFIRFAFKYRCIFFSISLIGSQN